ncbi:MAG TPA: GAF domain-containing protein [Thermodesulfobacteriota bacterium]|jgi:signal transduction histidine kinase/ActR/RegA family two-component response regulator|nr:GAF domain-containing protein [Thermodesulfobacteriota bacterium]
MVRKVDRKKGKAKGAKEDILRLNQELSILNAIGQVVNQSIDLDEIVNRSLDKIMEMTEVRSAGFYLLDEQNNELVYVAHRGFSKVFVKGMKRIKLGEGATGEVAQSGEPQFIDDYPGYPGAIPLAIEEGLKSIVVVPLKSRDKVYGTLNIARKEFHQFTPFEKSLFTAISQIIGGAIERAFLYSENVKRLEEQRTLFAVSQEIASRLELKVILQKIMEKAVELLEGESGEIVLWDSRRQNYATAIVQGASESLIGRELSSPSDGIVGEIITNKVPVLIHDYEHHVRRWKELDPYHLKEVVGVPLNVREMIIGAMVIGTSDPRKHFQQKDVDLLFNFANQAAIAIGNAKLYEDSLEKIKQLTTLYEVGKTLSSTLDLDELLKKALELLRDRFGYQLCVFLLLDQEKNELYVKQVIGGKIEKMKELRFRVGIDGIAGWVAKTGESYYAPDVSKDSRYMFGLPSTQSEAVFPLKIRDQVIGVLDVESDQLMGFNEEDLKVLSSLAGQVSIFIENAQLFYQLKQTLKELKQAQDQVIQAEKLRAMGEMASGVAHDFNNLLAVILGNIQLLLHQFDRLSPEEIRERLKIIEQSSKDGAETVRRIQEFSGMRRDKEFTPLSLNELITDLVNVTQPRWKEQTQSKGIQIELTKKLGKIPQILGNPSELREVTTNIVFNAVDAMPNGGEVTITTAVQAEDWVEMRIADTGIGMTEEVRKRVFDPFFTTKGVTNTGLGMSVSYGIIKRHGGEILIESEPGKGATFIIHLPTGYMNEIPDEKMVRTVPVTPLALEGGGARILVIDDEDSVRKILYQMLKAKGYQVVVASNGEEGIERFKEEPFDLVFTDLGMPKMSGWEVGRALKGINPKVPIALITGWGVGLNKDKMKESGIDLVVSKPFNFDQVVRLVSEAMELKEKI